MQRGHGQRCARHHARHHVHARRMPGPDRVELLRAGDQGQLLGEWSVGEDQQAAGQRIQRSGMAHLDLLPCRDAHGPTQLAHHVEAGPRKRLVHEDEAAGVRSEVEVTHDQYICMETPAR